jgi:hypothetical protein
MKQENNYWIDENNNRWNVDFYTEEQAITHSKTLIYCTSCRDYKTNPSRYVTPKIGSRNAQTVFYWTTPNDYQVICGCFRGNLKEFETQVADVHRDNEHGLNYKKQIKKVKYLLKD